MTVADPTGVVRGWDRAWRPVDKGSETGGPRCEKTVQVGGGGVRAQEPLDWAA